MAPAKVIELLKGGKGRFAVMVDGADGLPDEDFIETFARRSRAGVAQEGQGQEGPQVEAAPLIPPERETRVSGRATKAVCRRRPPRRRPRWTRRPRCTRTR